MNPSLWYGHVRLVSELTYCDSCQLTITGPASIEQGIWMPNIKDVEMYGKGATLFHTDGRGNHFFFLHRWLNKVSKVSMGLRSVAVGALELRY